MDFENQYLNDIESNNKIFYNSIFKTVADNIKRPLIVDEKEETVKFIKHIDPVLFNKKTKEKTVKIIIKTLTEQFQNKCIDTYKNVEKQDIGTTSETNTFRGIYDNNKNSGLESNINSSLVNFDNKAARLLNPDSFLRKNYIVLDSRYRIVEGTGPISSFKWVYSLGSQNNTEGSVNAMGNVREIVSMRTFPFRIPYIESADNKYARITVLLNNFSTQAFISNENRKFHFILQTKIDSDFIDLETDKHNDGYFYFETPFTTINIIELSFGSPFLPVVFDNDRDLCTIDYFIIAPFTQITTTINHNLSNGDRVYFSNFNVGVVSPLLYMQKAINDKIKADINSNEGFLVTVIDDVTFSIDYDSSSIQNPIDSKFNVFYGSKRFFMPIEFTFITPELNE